MLHVKAATMNYYEPRPQSHKHNNYYEPRPQYCTCEYPSVMEGADEELRSRRSNLRLDGEREEITEVLREGDEESDEDHWEEEVEEIVDVREGDGRRRAVRRTKSELTLALAVHTIALCYYIYVLVWDSTVVKNHKGPPSVWYGSTPYGGRWKFLTFINMVS